MSNVLLGGSVTTLIIIGVIVVGGGLLAFAVIRIVKSLLLNVSRSLPFELLNSLRKDVESGEFARRAQTPVSLSGMDKIYGPQIQSDFPELNLDELKQRAERLAYSTLHVIDTEDLTGLSEAGDLYRSQVRHYLASLQSLGQHERYANVMIHRTVIANYVKQKGTCRIQFQSAVGAEYQKLDADEQVIAGHAGLTQFKFELEALYIQGGVLLDSHDLEALAFNCPNCGAPVPMLGDKVCQYCGSAIEPMNSRVWTFCRFERS